MKSQAHFHSEEEEEEENKIESKADRLVIGTRD